ncbi:MAG: hypothetical protein HPY69_13840 [Armatimonadetes bacterium]|nr:hypothetical protein [Armatimonadota bacterium]
MLRRAVTAAGILVMLAAAVGAVHAASQAPYEPATGCYLGAYIELDHNTADDIGTFEQMVGKPHATYFRYVGYGQPFPYQWVKEMHARGIAPHIAWEPNHGLGAVRDDDYLHGWAQAAARTGGPIFLRYASEMNGNWMAYSGDPDLYIAKWRLVYRVMHEYAPNVVMIWCPFATPRSTIPVYYPGDEYVDWVGVNIYNVLHMDGDPAKPPSDDPRDQLKPIYDMFAARKPIAICEYAATHYCVATKTKAVDFAIDNMTKLYSALPTQFPRVRMINWFSVDTERDGLAHNNYCLTDDPEVLAQYRKLVADDYFISRVSDTHVVASTSPAAPESDTELPLPEPTQPVPPTRLPLAGTRLGSAPPAGVAIVLQGARPEAVSERVEIVADTGKQVQADAATFYVDGRFLAMTTVSPFRFTWDPTRLEPGVHDIKVVLSGYNDRTVATAEASVIVVRPTP